MGRNADDSSAHSARALPPCLTHRMREIMLQCNPGYKVLRGDEWVNAGLVLAGSWRLAEALAEGSG